MQAVVTLPKSDLVEINGDTPTLRLFALLEVIASKDQYFSLQSLVDETDLPKPTLHRMLQQLESAHLLERSADGRHYGTGVRLRRLAENLLLNDTAHGARHAVLRNLVAEVGSRVPVHCSASGKVFLSQMAPGQRQRLLGHAPLEAFTPKTLTDLGALESEVRNVRRQGFALDNEEFLPGLLCVAVAVPSAAGRANLCVAVQAPLMRLTADKALALLPALQRAAAALSLIETDATPALGAGGPVDAVALA
jgi:DNA-binding IclR family transcriptional regulator